MIEMVRIDHRLLHGQVAFSWTSVLGADCILIANDDAASNELKRTAMRLAKPSGVKLVIKSIHDSIDSLNRGITDKYKLFIIVGNINDAKALADNYSKIKSINIGGTSPSPNKTNISKTIAVTEEEKGVMRGLIDSGIDLYIQMVPSNSRIDVNKLV